MEEDAKGKDGNPVKTGKKDTQFTYFCLIKTLRTALPTHWVAQLFPLCYRLLQVKRIC